ncbi:MAG: hypothetical protein ACFFAD_09550 [Candidatus Hermodarchaeota archaeon]
MNYSLKEKFDEATSILREAAGSDELTTLIHRTPWVRILIEHDEHAGDAFFIVVEMSVPENPDLIELDSSKLLDQLSEHLEYFKRLRDVGFELSVIKAGCIYCASKELHDTPDDNLFRVLIPPSTD